MVYRLIVASFRLWTTNHFWKGRGYITWLISREWLKLVLLNSVHRNNTSSIAKEITNHPQNGHGWAHMYHFCMHNCRLYKILPRHAVKWGQQCCQWWTSVARTYPSRCQWCYILRLFDLLCICCKLVLFVLSTTNLPSGVWASSCTYELITNSCRSV